MKVHILAKLHKGPFGGGNQFLKAILKQFKKKNVYVNAPGKADVILFNSFPFGEEYRFFQAFRLKRLHKIIIYRVDGPIFKTRNKDYEVDRMISLFNEYFADGIIYQSEWSKNQNIKLGMTHNRNSTVITNAPDDEIFNPINKVKFSKDRKVKLIATSWAPSWMKGFKFYRFLDNNLDFNRYEMTFIGNSPIEFRNINWIKPLKSYELANELKNHDIFITASMNDPCSNSLIEALHCGLPAVAFNGGGHPEIVGENGEIFDTKEELLEKIDHVTNNYSSYLEKLNIPPIKTISERYFEFMSQIYQSFQQNKYKQKKPIFTNLLKLIFNVIIWKIKNGKFREISSLIFKNGRAKIRMVI